MGRKTGEFELPDKNSGASPNKSWNGVDKKCKMHPVRDGFKLVLPGLPDIEKIIVKKSYRTVITIVFSHGKCCSTVRGCTGPAALPEHATATVTPFSKTLSRRALTYLLVIKLRTPITQTHHFPLHSFMSHAITSTSSPNFQLIFNNALKAYEKRTRNDLLAHPLAAQLQDCNSPNAILAVIHQQFQGLHQSQGANERLTKWLDPTVKVLYSLSGTLGEGVSLVCLTEWIEPPLFHIDFTGFLSCESDFCRS